MSGKYFLYPVFLLISSGIGYAVAFFPLMLGEGAYRGALWGLAVGSLYVSLGIALDKFGTKRFLWGTLGLISGALVSGLISFFVDSLVYSLSPSDPHPINIFIWKAILLLFFPYLGMILALKIEKEPHLLEKRGAGVISNMKILDTSVIIDGRIADLCETGFLEGTFLIPQFVLHELQYVADSADSMRRIRGRRGLDVLHRLQQMVDFDLRIIDDDFPAIREVDAKIVALAQRLPAKVITNDLNLNKVAGLQGVLVLNINQLSNALKPVVLPGETMRIFVSKEGKEAGQGVAYLDDGTMIVIDDARKSIGKKVEVAVTSVLQTAGGRMIFAKMREEAERHPPAAATAKAS